MRLRIQIEGGEPFIVWARPDEVREGTSTDPHLRGMEPVTWWHCEMWFRAGALPLAPGLVTSIVPVDMPPPDGAELVRNEAAGFIALRLTYRTQVLDFRAVALADEPTAQLAADVLPRQRRSRDYCRHIGAYVDAREHRRSASQEAARRRRPRSLSARIGRLSPDERVAVLQEQNALRGGDPILAFMADIDQAERAWAAGRPTTRDTPRRTEAELAREIDDAEPYEEP